MIIFLVFWLGMIILLGLGAKFGDPYKLLMGTDYEGNTCGVANTGTNPSGVVLSDMTTKKRITYPRLIQDILLQQSKGLTVSNPLSFSFFGVCTAACPKVNDIVCTDKQAARNAVLYPTNTAQEVRLCLQSNLPASMKSAACTEVSSGCWINLFDTTSVFFRCIPSSSTNSQTQSFCAWPQPGICAQDSDCGTKATDKCNAITGNPPRGVCTPLQASDPRCEQKLINTTTSVQQPSQSTFLFSALNNVGAVWTRYFADVRTAWYVILVCGIVGAIAFGFIWVLFLRSCAGPMVWTTVWLFFFAMVLATLFCLLKGGTIPYSAVTNATAALALSNVNTASLSATSNSTNAIAFQIVGWILAIATVILLFVIIAVAKKINLTVKIVQESAKAVQDMPFMMFFPFTTVVSLFVLFIYFVFVGILLMSAGSLTVDQMVQAGTQASSAIGFNYNATGIITSLSAYKSNNVLNYLAIYHLFGFLWTAQFVQAVGMCTLAGAVSKWYFSREKKHFDKMPVMHSLWITLRYHLGSLAFGAAIVAIVQLIRIILAYIDHQTKNAQKSNKFLALLMKIVQCCLCCFEKCLKWINKNVFILVAMKNKNFCTGCKNAFELIKDNLITIGTVTAVGNLMIFLGKLVITALCMSACFIWLSYAPNFQNTPTAAEPISSPFVPTLVCAIIGFLVGSAFLYVFEMTVDTILLCFCEDQKAEPYYASRALMKCMSQAKKAGQEDRGRAPAQEDGDDDGTGKPLVEG